MIQRLQLYSVLLPNSGSGFRRTIEEKADDLRSHWQGYGLAEVSVFVVDEHVCLYVETSDAMIGAQWDWPEAFGQYLKKWPYNRFAVPMIDIFHDGVPVDATSWRGNCVVEQRVGSIARLNPEWVSSYIHYHYQMQEEAPDSFNKTYIIGIIGRLIFSYSELPANISDPKRSGKLNTKLTPDNWHAAMRPHFEMWEGVPEEQQLWRRMERIIGSNERG